MLRTVDLFEIEFSARLGFDHLVEFFGNFGEIVLDDLSHLGIGFKGLRIVDVGQNFFGLVDERLKIGVVDDVSVFEGIDEIVDVVEGRIFKALSFSARVGLEDFVGMFDEFDKCLSEASADLIGGFFPHVLSL